MIAGNGLFVKPHWLLLFEEDLAKPINLPHLLRALLPLPFVSFWEIFHLCSPQVGTHSLIFTEMKGEMAIMSWDNTHSGLIG